MTTYKRGSFYWYKFMWNGKLLCESTKQGNDKIARKMEAAHRTRLAEGLVGIREKRSLPLWRTFWISVSSPGQECGHLGCGSALAFGRCSGQNTLLA